MNLLCVFYLICGVAVWVVWVSSAVDDHLKAFLLALGTSCRFDFSFGLTVFSRCCGKLKIRVCLEIERLLIGTCEQENRRAKPNAHRVLRRFNHISRLSPISSRDLGQSNNIIGGHFVLYEGFLSLLV